MLGKAWTDVKNSTGIMRSESPTTCSIDQSVLPPSQGNESPSTMHGDSFPDSSSKGGRKRIDDDVGIIPRCLTDIYATLNDREAKGEIEFSIHVQVMQIYNEKIYDMLQDKRRENPLNLRETGGKLSKIASSVNNSLTNSGNFGGSGSGGVYVQGLSEYRVDTREDVLSILKRAMRNRAVRSTEMNLESSRSHTILQLLIEVRDKGGDRKGISV